MEREQAVVSHSPPSAVDSPHGELFSPIRCNFSAARLNRELSELFFYRDYLRLRLTLLSPDEDFDHYQDLRRLLAVVDQQLSSGRRDHARSERMLEIYQSLRSRIVTNSERITQAGGKGCTGFELILDHDCQFAKRLSNVMYLAAAYSPDDSEYSRAWRETLIWHVGDLNQLATAAQASRPLRLPYYSHDTRATGRFDFVSKGTQAETLKVLRRHFNFLPIKQTTATAVAYSEVSMQMALVSADGAIRYIDLIDLLCNYAEFPDCKLPATADDNHPPSVSFTSQSGAPCKFIYNWKALRYA